jgi:hypothetical protein
MRRSTGHGSLDEGRHDGSRQCRIGTSGIDDLGEAELVIVILALDGGGRVFDRLAVQEPKLTGEPASCHDVPERSNEISAAGCWCDHNASFYLKRRHAAQFGAATVSSMYTFCSWNV